jgi:UDP-galactopyranose mutase
VRRPDVVVVGAGLFGLVAADRLTSLLPGVQVIILESADRIGGLCTTMICPHTGVTYNPYGTHTLATSDPRAWAYVQSRTRMISHRQRVYADVGEELVPLPLGLEAIRLCYGGPSLTPDEARRLVERDAAPHRTGRAPVNAEEAALAAVGPRLYDMFVRGHITKQWGTAPDQLAPGVFSDRFSIRFTPTTGYRTTARWQGFSARGWNAFFDRLTDNRDITVLRNTPATAEDLPLYSHACIVTTPIDAWFGHAMGTLARGRISVDWLLTDQDTAPGAALATYPGMHVPHYRTHTPGHLPGQAPHGDDKVLVGYEHHGDGQHAIDFVLRTPANEALAKAYRARASRTDGFYFAGRGTTFHHDMGTTIAAALALAAQLAKTIERSPACP